MISEQRQQRQEPGTPEVELLFCHSGWLSPVHEKTLGLGLLNGDLSHAVEITRCPRLLHAAGLLQGNRTTLLGLTAYLGKQRVVRQTV